MLLTGRATIMVFAPLTASQINNEPPPAQPRDQATTMQLIGQLRQTLGGIATTSAGLDGDPETMVDVLQHVSETANDALAVIDEAQASQALLKDAKFLYREAPDIAFDDYAFVSTRNGERYVSAWVWVDGSAKV